MRILLDTHIFLWAVNDDARLSSFARSIIQDATAVFISVASFWEMAIKMALGKLDADMEEMVHITALSGFQELPVTMQHIVRLASLPQVPGHKDPFDRLLVAQSMAEPLILVTADAKIEAYGGLVHRV